MWPNPQFLVDMATFTGQILNGKLHFLCSDYSYLDKTKSSNSTRGTPVTTRELKKVILNAIDMNTSHQKQRNKP